MSSSFVHARSRIGAALVAAAALLALAGSAQPAAAKSKLPRSFTGVLSTEVAPYGHRDEWDAQLADMSKAGVGLIRPGFDANAGLDHLDDFVLTAARHKVRLLPMLLDTKRYDPNPGADHGFHPPSTKSFTRWAGLLTARYGPKGTLWTGPNAYLRSYAITAWQVWNEPNLPTYWLPKPNPKAYAKLVKATGKAIHREDRRATIVSAGIPDSTQSKPYDYAHYLAKFVKAGGAKAVDAIGVHAYAPSVKGFVKVLKTYRRILDRNHGRKLRLWVTEFGWADKGHRNKMVVGAKGQASRITGAYKQVAKLRKTLKLIGLTYYQWEDYTRPPGDRRGDTWGYHTGLLTAQGVPKAAFRSWKKIIAKLAS